MCSLLTTIIPHIRSVVFVIDAKISNMVNVLPLDIKDRTVVGAFNEIERMPIT